MSFDILKLTKGNIKQCCPYCDHVINDNINSGLLDNEEISNQYKNLLHLEKEDFEVKLSIKANKCEKCEKNSHVEFLKVINNQAVFDIENGIYEKLKSEIDIHADVDTSVSVIINNNKMTLIFSPNKDLLFLNEKLQIILIKIQEILSKDDMIERFEETKQQFHGICYFGYTFHNIKNLINRIKRQILNGKIAQNLLFNMDFKRKLSKIRCADEAKVSIENIIYDLEYDYNIIEKILIKLLTEKEKIKELNDLETKCSLFISLEMPKNMFVDNFSNQEINNKIICNKTNTEKVILHIPYSENKKFKDEIFSVFLKAVKSHVNKINDEDWKKYKLKSEMKDFTYDKINFDYNEILNISRESFVEKVANKMPWNDYLHCFINKPENQIIGEIEGESIYYHESGVYAYINEDLNIEFSVYLTFPSYPLGW